jgi:hypothetical protein
MPNEEIFLDPYLPVLLPGNPPSTSHTLNTDSGSLLLEEDP